MTDLLTSELEQEGHEADRETDGTVRGLAVGVVTDNKDPEGLARVRVHLPWQPESDQTFWARLAVPMAMGSRGVYFLPEVGDEVLVGFEMGDPTHPCIVGSLWNGQNAPPEDNGDGKNDPRVIRTRSESELRFFDGDPPSVDLKLADGKRLFMDDQGVTLEDGSGNFLKIETSSGAITIKCSGELKLESDAKVSIKAGASMDIKASGTLMIEAPAVNIN